MANSNIIILMNLLVKNIKYCQDYWKNMKRILLILTSSAAFLLVLFIIIGHSVPRDLDERAAEALEYERVQHRVLSAGGLWQALREDEVLSLGL